MPVPQSALAAVDIGSNSFRLEIAQVLQGRYRRIDYLKETVRLGAGLDAAGALTEAAVERGLECLRRFRERLAGFPPGSVRAVATQTLREATNRDAFLVRADEALGAPIEVLSGREEARLIYAGVARLQPSSTPRLVIDIGGRSTELILGRGRTAHAAESFAIGSVGLSVQYFADGVLDARSFRAAQVAAGAELEEALGTFAPSRWREALGSSGTVGAVSQWLASAGVSDGTVTPEGLRWCIEQCLAAGRVERLVAVKEDRRAVVAGGLAILYTLATQFGIAALQPARGALRHGLIFDLAEQRARGARGDTREQSVRELQRRFAVDAAQARRVRRLALALYRQLSPAARLESLRELGWAGNLHEVGMSVSHHDHHRHSAYIVAHADAPGFSQSQQRRVAALVLGQRGGLRKVEAELADDDFADRLMALRLAIVAGHARGPVAADALRVERRGAEATVRCDPRWAASHPRTLHLLGAEAEAWSRSSARTLAVAAGA